MARVVLCPYGSAGDINPFVAVAVALRDRGHDVLFAVEDRFRPLLTSEGFEVGILPGDTMEALAPHVREVTGGTNPTTTVKLLVSKRLLPTLRPTVEALIEICTGADLLVNTVLQFAASFVADITGITWASIALTPLNVPAASIESVQLPGWLPGPFRRQANRAIWSTGRSQYRKVADAPINAIRAEYGLAPRRDLLFTGNLSSKLIAVAVSPAFMPPPPEWPNHVKMTGFCFWDTPTSWTDSSTVMNFINSSQPVVAVSAGSTTHLDREAFEPFYRTSITAIRRNNGRALIIGADPGSLPDPLPEGVLAVPFAPFSRVYPHCAAVIHHGGIGTIAQALRAGVPMLVVPWGADQFFNGAQIARIGAGRSMLRSRYTLDEVQPAVDLLLRDATYRQKAQAIAAHLVQENGVGVLADALEGTLDRF